MLDTVIVSSTISPISEQLDQWEIDIHRYSDRSEHITYTKKTRMKNGAFFSCVYYPPNRKYHNPWLGIQVSLPAVIHGRNIETLTTISEIDEAIECVNKFISGLNWLPAIDFGAGHIYRLDPVYNHHVGDYVTDYIKFLRNFGYPQRKTLPYLFEGVKFKGKVISTMFYDKYIESRSSLAKGILRQETKITTPVYIEKKTGLVKPILRDLTFPILVKILQQDLDELHLTNALFVGRSTAYQLLTDKYGFSLGLTLYGYLQRRQYMSRDEMISMGAKAGTTRKYEKQIHDAGVSPALIEDGTILPPLEIKLPEAPGCHLS